MPDYLTHDEFCARLTRAVHRVAGESTNAAYYKLFHKFAAALKERIPPDRCISCGRAMPVYPDYRNYCCDRCAESPNKTLHDPMGLCAPKPLGIGVDHPDDHPINQAKPIRDPSKEIEVGDKVQLIGDTVNPQQVEMIAASGLVITDQTTRWYLGDYRLAAKRPDRPGDVFEVIETGEYVIAAPPQITNPYIHATDGRSFYRSRLRRVLCAREAK